MKHGAGSFSPQNLSFSSPFLFSSSMKAANQGTAISSGSLLVSVTQEQLRMQALSPLPAAGLCTSWLVLPMFKTLTGNILFCWITYQTTRQWNFQGLRNCAWRYSRGLADSFSRTLLERCSTARESSGRLPPPHRVFKVTQHEWLM